MAEKNKQEVRTIPVAKRSALLEDINKQLSGLEIDATVTVAGHKYYMTTLSADEEVWGDNYVNVESPAGFFTSQRIPRLAAAIKKIDGKSIENLFDFPEEASKEDKEFHTGSQYRMRYWAMNQMLLWLGDQSPQFIQALWTEFAALNKRRNASWDELKNSSGETPGGEQKAASSPEKESSPATQQSVA